MTDTWRCSPPGSVKPCSGPRALSWTLHSTLPPIAAWWLVTAQVNPGHPFPQHPVNDFVDRDPIDWNLQASQDGENWVTLDSRAGEIFPERFQLRIFRFTNTVAYKFYRLNITRNRSGDAMQLADWSVNIETEETETLAD